MTDIKVTDALFALLRTVLREDCNITDGDKEILRENLSDIYAISKRNDMAHLIGYALEKQGLISPEDKLFAKFQKQQYLAIYRCEGMEYEISRMRDVLEAGGIDFILLKGAVLRSLYPEGWMRTSSDIDILVHSEDLERAGNILTDRLGYNKVMEGTHDHSFFSEGGVHVELHFDLVEEDRAHCAKEVLSDVWSYTSVSEGKKFEHEMSEGMFYFYHIAHLAKHVEEAGSGMRPFVDLWLINNRNDKNETERDELLSRCSLKKFARNCDEMSAHWFGEKKEIDVTVQRFEQFVLNCGIYGSEENRIIIDRNKSGGTLGYIGHRLFLPYDVLGMLYPVVKKHKWLIPFCQVARWFKLLSGKMARKAIGEIKISSAATKQDVSEMQEFLSDIGL